MAQATVLYADALNFPGQPTRCVVSTYLQGEP